MYLVVRGKGNTGYHEAFIITEEEGVLKKHPPMPYYEMRRDAEKASIAIMALDEIMIEHYLKWLAEQKGLDYYDSTTSDILEG